MTEYVSNIDHEMVHQVKVGDVFNFNVNKPDDCRKWYIPKLQVVAIEPYDDQGREEKEFRVLALEDGNYFGQLDVDEGVEYKLNPYGLFPV